MPKNIFDSFKLVPIYPKSKKPIRSDWLNNTVSFDWFSDHPDLNIGVLLGEPGDGIIDIDLDSQEAIKIAEYFLPKTQMHFGRQSKPLSHWIYRVEAPGSTVRFQHGNHGTLVEYRSTGSQTVFPPSIHESGEPIVFSSDGEPSVVDNDELMKVVRRLAAATLTALSWKRGTRHDSTMALAGWLIKSGWKEQEVSKFVEAICAAANDEESADRALAVQSTVQCIDKGEPSTGWPRLSEIFGKEVASKLAEWLELDSQSLWETRESSSVSSLVPSPEALRSLPESETDIGNALRFAHRHGERCFYHSNQGAWYFWNGNVWKPVPQLEVEGLAQETARSMFSEAGSDMSMISWARQSCSSSRVASMVSLSKPYLAKSVGEINSDTYLFNCQNGTLDLKTRVFREHRRSDLITEIANVAYAENAKATRFTRFVDEITCGDGHLARYLKTLCGYCLSGETSEQKLTILFGNGANGKGTFVETFNEMLGDYSRTAQADTLMQRTKASGSDATPDIARLVGARVVFLSEGDRSHKLDEAFVKQATGQDVITARPLYGSPFEFVPKFKLIFSSNYLPKIRGTDNGIWRRLDPVPLNATFEGERRDKSLRDQLRSEASGILNWALEGFQDWMTNGLVEPIAITNARKAYRTDSDNVSRFLTEETQRQHGKSVPKADLYKAYANWIRREGEHYTASNREFSELVEKAGFTEKRTSAARSWDGLVLNNPNLAYMS